MVDSRVEHRVVAALAVLHIGDRGHQPTAVPDEIAPRLEGDHGITVAPARQVFVEDRGQRGPQTAVDGTLARSGVGRREPTAEVEQLERDAEFVAEPGRRAHAVRQLGVQPLLVAGVGEREEVHAHDPGAFGEQPGPLPGQPVQVEPELRGPARHPQSALPGGARCVDAQHTVGDHPVRRSRGADPLQITERLGGEGAHPRRDRLVQLRRHLAGTGVHQLGGWMSRLQRGGELPARGDLGARPAPAQLGDEAGVRIGLERVVDAARLRQGGPQVLQSGAQPRQVVDVQRAAVLLDQPFDEVPVSRHGCPPRAACAAPCGRSCRWG